MEEAVGSNVVKTLVVEIITTIAIMVAKEIIEWEVAKEITEWAITDQEIIEWEVEDHEIIETTAVMATTETLKKGFNKS
jgi:hypothetical protein